MIKKGKKPEENLKSFPVYKGLVLLNIEAINPTAQQIHELRGYEPATEPVYVSQTAEGKPMVRLDFFVKASSLDNQTTFKTRFSMFLRKETITGQTSGKTMIIDKYGRTAWATPEDLQNKRIPQYANGPADIDSLYRPAFKGEAELVDLLRAWLNLPVASAMDENKNRVPSKAFKEDPESCEATLDMNRIFSGDFSELKKLVAEAVNFEFKAAAGVKMYNGKWVQDILNIKFAKYFTTNYKSLEMAVMQTNTANSERMYSIGALVEVPQPSISPSTEEEIAESTASNNSDDDLPF